MPNAKRGGLIKKTISFTVGQTKYIIISYYTLNDVLGGRITRVRHSPAWPVLNLPTINPRADLWDGKPKNSTIVNDGGVGDTAQIEIWSTNVVKVQRPIAPQAAPAGLPAPAGAPQIGDNATLPAPAGVPQIDYAAALAGTLGFANIEFAAEDYVEDY
jgi:hypothetical protein